jgi:hypothetical protein
MLEEDQIDVAGSLRRVRRRGRRGLDLVDDCIPLLLVGLHERDVDDVERQLSGRIVSQLVVTAQVDHCSDAVVCDGLPAGMRELPNAVRSDDSAITGLASVLRRKPA